MSYQAAIPAATDQLSVSQGDLQNNFGALNTYLGVNHVGFNGSDQGKHVFITFPVQTVNPSVTPGFNTAEIGLYNFNYSVTGKNELFVNKISGAGSVQKPITASLLSYNATPAQGTAGWTYLPSGLLIMWGTTNSVSGTYIQTIPVGANIPVYTQILSVQITPFLSGGTTSFSAIFSGIVSPTQFNVWLSTTAGFNWLVIGW